MAESKTNKIGGILKNIGMFLLGVVGMYYYNVMISIKEDRIALKDDKIELLETIISEKDDEIIERSLQKIKSIKEFYNQEIYDLENNSKIKDNTIDSLKTLFEYGGMVDTTHVLVTKESIDNAIFKMCKLEKVEELIDTLYYQMEIRDHLIENYIDIIAIENKRNELNQNIQSNYKEIIESYQSDLSNCKKNNKNLKLKQSFFDLF